MDDAASLVFMAFSFAPVTRKDRFFFFHVCPTAALAKVSVEEEIFDIFCVPGPLAFSLSH